jgi:hypothetical protein
LTVQDLSRFLEIAGIPVQKKGLTERALDDKVLFVNELPVDFSIGSTFIPAGRNGRPGIIPRSFGQLIPTDSVGLRAGGVLLSLAAKVRKGIDLEK